MSDKMPESMTEEAVAAWCREVCCLNVQRIPASELRSWEQSSGKEGWRIVASRFLALVEAKVREAVAHPRERVVAQSCGCCSDVVEITPDEIVARVMGKEVANG